MGFVIFEKEGRQTGSVRRLARIAGYFGAAGKLLISEARQIGTTSLVGLPVVAYLTECLFFMIFSGDNWQSFGVFWERFDSINILFLSFLFLRILLY